MNVGTTMDARKERTMCPSRVQIYCWQLPSPSAHILSNPPTPSPHLRSPLTLPQPHPLFASPFSLFLSLSLSFSLSLFLPLSRSLYFVRSCPRSFSFARSLPPSLSLSFVSDKASHHEEFEQRFSATVEEVLAAQVSKISSGVGLFSNVTVHFDQVIVTGLPAPAERKLIVEAGGGKVAATISSRAGSYQNLLAVTENGKCSAVDRKKLVASVAKGGKMEIVSKTVFLDIISLQTDRFHVRVAKEEDEEEREEKQEEKEEEKEEEVKTTKRARVAASASVPVPTRSK